MFSNGCIFLTKKKKKKETTYPKKCDWFPTCKMRQFPVFLLFFLLSVVFVGEILSWRLDCVCVCVCVCVCMCALSVDHSCPTLWDPMDCSPPGFSVHGISRERMLEWVAVSFPGYLPSSEIETALLVSLALGGRFFTTAPPYPLTDHDHFIVHVSSL